MIQAKQCEFPRDTQSNAAWLRQQIEHAGLWRDRQLLVPAEHDTVAFENRSHQEQMAGRALSNGTDEEIRERLHLTAPGPHWRNAWVFAAGRTFTEGADSRRDLIVTITETTDKRPGCSVATSTRTSGTRRKPWQQPCGQPCAGPQLASP